MDDKELMSKRTILIPSTLWDKAKTHKKHFTSVGEIIRVLLWGYTHNHINLMDIIDKMDDDN